MSGLDDVKPVEDTNNLNQTLQIRQINNARNKAREVRNRAQEQIASADGSELARARHGGRQVYLQVVKSYALELAPLIAEHNQDLWNGETLVATERQHTASKKHAKVIDIQPEAVPIEVVGVKDLIMTEFPVRTTFEVTYRESGSREQAETQSSAWVPNFAETDAILVNLDNARKQLGIYLEGPDEVGVESDEHV